MPEANGKLVPTPQIGTVWHHHEGGLYVVYDVTNLIRGKANFPTRVVYLDAAGNTFSRDLDQWAERYRPAEGLNAYEQAMLANAALHVQGSKDILQKRFLEAVTAMNARKAVAAADVSFRGDADG